MECSPGITDIEIPLQKLQCVQFRGRFDDAHERQIQIQRRQSAEATFLSAGKERIAGKLMRDADKLGVCKNCLER